MDTNEYVKVMQDIFSRGHYHHARVDDTLSILTSPDKAKWCITVLHLALELRKLAAQLALVAAKLLMPVKRPSSSPSPTLGQPAASPVSPASSTASPRLDLHANVIDAWQRILKKLDKRTESRTNKNSNWK